MDRQTEMPQNLVWFLQQTIHTDIRVYIPKGTQASCKHCRHRGRLPYSHSGFLLSDPKTQGVDINVYLTFYVSEYHLQ